MKSQTRIIKNNTLRIFRLTSFAVLILILFSVRGIFAQDEFELAESVPVETSFENTDLKLTAEVWEKMIKNAAESIDIETFYFADEKDEPMENVLKEIINASIRGVKIRIIVDSGFYAGSDKSVDKLENFENITIRKIPFSNLAGGVMHAKYFIVDRENVFVGSQNFDWRALKHIHETGARIKNKRLAMTFSELFEFDWNLCEGVRTERAYSDVVNSENKIKINTADYGEILLYPAFSPSGLTIPDVNSEETELLKIISETKQSLFIQVYSYSSKLKKDNNYLKIDSALRNAAQRGVEIKIIFPDWAVRENTIDFIKDLSTVKNIQIKFSSIPEFSKGFIPYARVEHCKYFISDSSISWISTSNWEWSYFNASRNATLIIENKKINEELKKMFYRSWDSKYTEFVDVNKNYTPVRKN